MIAVVQHDRLIAARQRLLNWLIEHAYPRWANSGIDKNTGAFVEAIAVDGTFVAQPRRLRVQARQIIAFSQARSLNADTEPRDILRRGLESMSRLYRRADGLFRTLVDVDGRVIDERALLYDQAFVLLAFAAAASALEEAADLEIRARELRVLIQQRLRSTDGAFLSEVSRPTVRESNPHMHLLEACLAWSRISQDSEWRRWVHELIDLALSRLIRQDSGALTESYTETWAPTRGVAGRIIEPGHQFEWAWLLLQCESLNGTVRDAALRLIAIGERYGVVDGLAVNSLLDDFSLYDANARLWPQTERLKASLLAADITQEEGHWSAGIAAAEALLLYINERTPGLWYDLSRPLTGVVKDSAPASTFYHVVGAIQALQRAGRAVE